MGEAVRSLMYINDPKRCINGRADKMNPTAGSSLQLEPEYFGFFHILPADRVCMYVIHLLNEIIFSFNHLRHGGCIVSKKKVQVANLNPPENNKG